MRNEFTPCELPWSTGVWGLQLTHSDTDVLPECKVAFNAMQVAETRPWTDLWVEVEFDDATFARASPHRDDEDLTEVTGYAIPARQGDYHADEAEWLRTGTCPDPGFYFCNDSEWLNQCRPVWSSRNRSRPSKDAAVHFLLDGRDGYVEVIASAFAWKAWHTGHPILSDIDRANPIAEGRSQQRRSPSTLRRVDGPPIEPPFM